MPSERWVLRATVMERPGRLPELAELQGQVMGLSKARLVTRILRPLSCCAVLEAGWLAGLELARHSLEVVLSTVVTF